MTMTDPVADFLTRVRNANAIRKEAVAMPISKVRTALAIVLKDEGFIADFSLESETKPGTLTLKLRYDQDGEKAIRAIRRMSKPGCRKYITVREIPKVANGQGISILSTTRGIVSGRKAKEFGVGGELLATVW